MYLIDGLPMSYDLNLFKFILSLMEIMCFVQESMEMPKLGWNWIQECSSIKRNWNMQQCVGKTFRSKAIVGHWYTIMSIDLHEHVMIDLHEHVMIVMMVLR